MDRSGSGGFSLVELLVAVALLGVIAVLSAQLVIQSTRLMDTSARASRNPDLVLTGEWIRRDLYEAVGVIGGVDGWTREPLIAVAQDGGRVSFGAVEGVVIRSLAMPGTSMPDQRAILHGVTSWRWRVDDNRLVRVEIGALANPHAHRGLTGSARLAAERRIERVAFALRGQPGGASW